MTMGHRAASSSPTRPRRAIFGSLLLFGCLGLLLLCAVHEAQGLQGMPRFWYVNRTMWWAFAVGGIVAGAWNLMPVDENQLRVTWKPSRPGVRFRAVTIYTRQGCHLCEDALQLLRAHQRWLPTITEFDIDRDPALVASYGECVPVVVCDDKVRFRGRVRPELLQRLIEGTAPR